VTPPDVELLYWPGCPSHPRALADLREAMSELGLDPAVVNVRQVDSEEQAREEGFIGSPTIRIDGRDIQPPPEGEPTGLTCRIYHRRDGRVSPTPDPLDVREALRG
jgi:glutaredoxin